MAETGSLGVNMVEFVLGGGSPTNRNAQDRNRMTGAFVSVLLSTTFALPVYVFLPCLSASAFFFLLDITLVDWVLKVSYLSLPPLPP